MNKMASDIRKSFLNKEDDSMRSQDNFEIAFVINNTCLLDAESYQRLYFRAGGLGLAKGFYIVTWPEMSPNRQFDEETLFFGPFRHEPEARATLRRLDNQLKNNKSGKSDEKIQYPGEGWKERIAADLFI